MAFAAMVSVGLLSLGRTCHGQPAGDDAARSESEATATPSRAADRVRWTTSRVVGTPVPPPPYVLKRCFSQLNFSEPVYLTPEPGSSRLFLVQYKGKILAFDDDQDADQTQLVHDMQRNTYSVAFHPDYQRNGYLYVFTNGPEDDRHNRISRFQMRGPEPRTCDAESETVILEWASAGHDGGDMAFGPDGCLYITAGDGSSDSDTHQTGQDITDLPGSILRIDVDHREAGKNYGIPPDNPFVDHTGARPEIWAFGLRNPWRMSFDRRQGRLWVGDVGQDLWEMVYLVSKGANFGWSHREGNQPFYTNRPLGPAPLVPPVVEHSHSESRSITGGFVYSGSRHAELAGVYIYCDYETGIVWGFRYGDGKVTEHRVLADSSNKVSSFGLDHRNELYLVDYGGKIFRLERAELQKERQQPFPRALSETGLFSSVQDLQPAAGTIPYSVNAPYWADGADIERLLGVPGDDQITVNENRAWGFTDKAVLAQTLSFELQPGDPGSRRRIETRLLTRQAGEWYGYSYQWDEDQSDATLVDTNGKDLTLWIQDATQPDGRRRHTWRIPSRQECMVCHSRAVGFVLGLSTLQMNRPHGDGTDATNQLDRLDEAGILTETLAKPAADYPSLVDPYDGSADIGLRARAYLHANCSHCHVSAGGGNAQMELEWITPLEKARILDVPPLHGSFGLADARLVAPADPYRSVLLYRMAKLGRGRMPHLGSRVVDEQAVQLFYQWIEQLSLENGADGASPPPTVALRRAEAESTLDQLVALEDRSAEADAAKLDALLRSTAGAMLLRRGVAEHRIRDVNRAAWTQHAALHPDDHVRDLFESFLPEEERTERLGSAVRPETILRLDGNAASGKLLFFVASGVQCRNCHRIHGEGTELGPDLDQIGKKYNPTQLLETILEPSRQIEAQFATYLVETASGRVHSGLLARKTDTELVLTTAERKVIRIPAEEVVRCLPQSTSIMPELLLKDMTAQQVADLLAYLCTLK